jgi:hypothetical protein
VGELLDKPAAKDGDAGRFVARDRNERSFLEHILQMGTREQRLVSDRLCQALSKAGQLLTYRYSHVQ